MNRNTENLRKKLHNLLTMNGFSIRREFSSLVIEKLLQENVELNTADNLDVVVKKLCNNLEKQCINEQSIEKEHILKAINACLESHCDESETVFNVIPAFQFPRLKYSIDRKLYSINTTKSRLFGDADSRIHLFRERYSTILQRMKRYIDSNNLFKLQTIDYVLTLTKVKLDKTMILGALLQASECKYYLEDPTGFVEIDLTNANYGDGFFMENTFVLVTGLYEDRVLHVASIVLPHFEDYNQSRPTFGNINYFGGSSEYPLRDSHHLKEYMLRNDRELMYIFSDFWLDNEEVFEKMELMFSNLREPPIAFIFLGNFIQESQNTSECIEMIREKLKTFAELIDKYVVISRNTHFVFVPGLSDPCTPYIAPRFGLPKYMTEAFRNLIPNAHFTTNPCRIQYCSREITIFRANLATKFLQGTLKKPKSNEIGKWVSKTVLSQGHLSPMPLNALTVNWEYDYCLHLYPLSDLVIIGDSHAKYTQNVNESHVLNPGPFCDSDFTFYSYTPSTNTIEECGI